MFHSLEPEVAGGFGQNTILDNSTHPPIVRRLHYELDGWLGDDLLESFPCYIITDRLRTLIEEVGATGYAFDSVEVTTSEQFRQLYPDRQIPRFWWLKVTGKAGVDDFGMSSEDCLVVSDRMFTAMMDNCQLDNCDEI